MTLYRIVRDIYRNDLSGEGAEKYGGRWNSIGVRALYCCENRSLALLEVLVNTHVRTILKNFVIVSIEIPDDRNLFFSDASSLPINWKEFPINSSTRKFGDSILLKENYLGFKIPSSIMPFEYNYVLNPLHPDFNTIKIIDVKPFEIDTRL